MCQEIQTAAPSKLIAESLVRAIQCYEGDTGPGVWKAVENYDGNPEHVGIIFTVRESEDTLGLAEIVSNLDDAVLCERWGGDAILFSAGLMFDPTQKCTWGELDEIDGAMEYSYWAKVKSFVSDALMN
jgi:hypothetical protein